MASMRQMQQYVLALLMLTSGAFAGILNELPGDWGKPANGLQMALCPMQKVWATADDPMLQVPFKNVRALLMQQPLCPYV